MLFPNPDPRHAVLHGSCKIPDHLCGLCRGDGRLCLRGNDPGRDDPGGGLLHDADLYGGHGLFLRNALDPDGHIDNPYLDPDVRVVQEPEWKSPVRPGWR